MPLRDPYHIKLFYSTVQCYIREPLTISALTASQGSLSSLSMAEQMARNLLLGRHRCPACRPGAARWFSLICTPLERLHCYMTILL